MQLGEDHVLVGIRYMIYGICYVNGGSCMSWLLLGYYCNAVMLIAAYKHNRQQCQRLYIV